MNIALAHYRINGTDGVSLEMRKWYECLTLQNHKCIYISGSKPSDVNCQIQGIDFKDEFNKKIVDNCYTEFKDYETTDELKKLIFERADIIEKELSTIVEKNKIECLIVANIMSLGWNLSACIAFTNFARKNKKIKVLLVASDIYWERELYVHPVVDFVRDILDDYFLPDLVNVKHCAISELARIEIIKRRGLHPFILNKVIDFENSPTEVEAISEKLRKVIGAEEKDIVILNPSRIEPRKAIEFTIELANAIKKKSKKYIGKQMYNKKVFNDDSKIHLIFYGTDDSFGSSYIDNLKNKMDSYNIKYINLRDIIGSTRSGEEKFCYLDAYYIADAIVSGSVLEGWGNHILEASVSKKPLAIFEYPVFKSDIKKLGLKICSLGDTFRNVRPLKVIPQRAIEKAADQMLDVIFNEEKYQKAINKNYNVCHKNFSFRALSNNLKKLLRF